MVFKKNLEVNDSAEVDTIEVENNQSLKESSKDLRSTYIDAINALCSSIQSQIDSLYKIRQLLKDLSDDE